VSAAHGTESPSAWIERFAHLVRPGGQVLDVACGLGRHARYFAARGCLVDAVDRDPNCAAALAGVLRVRFLAADIENGRWPYDGRLFDAIVVTNYLYRPLFPRLLSSLARGGVLLYETFAAGNERYGKPSNPEFLLLDRELLERCAPLLHVLAFEDGISSQPRLARVQRLIGLRCDATNHARIALDGDAAAADARR
jgi:SAM-dependent methyltransferase